MVRVNGETTVVGVVTDAETGQVLGLDVLVERDADGFMERLGDFARDYCVAITVSRRWPRTTLARNKAVVERLGIDHQICMAHARKRAGGVPWTNNVTERTIGRSKIRRKTVREYKSEDWMLNGFGLRRWAWSGRDGLEL